MPRQRDIDRRNAYIGRMIAVKCKFARMLWDLNIISSFDEFRQAEDDIHLQHEKFDEKYGCYVEQILAMELFAAAPEEGKELLEFYTQMDDHISTPEINIKELQKM